MRVLPLLVLCSLTACAPKGNGKLESRLTALEAAHAKTEFELTAAIKRLDATVEALAGAVGDGSGGSGQIDRILEQLVALQEQLDDLADAKPAAPSYRPQRRAEPDPAKVYAVPVTGSPVRGKPDALVTIVRAGEYACPYCERVRSTLDDVMAAYPDDVRIVYKHYVVHQPTANAASYAACAAQKQGKFWEMDKLLWEKTFANREFEAAQIEAVASGLGLDMKRYRADIAGPCPKVVADDMAMLTKFGVAATPVFFINGRYLAGAQPLASFTAIIDEELTKARDAVKQGTKKAKYYDQVVIKKGLPALENAATP